ncbi:MAG: indole-3-glycerol phosphate synthase TrpC [Thermoguttaceae bacterium]
MNVLDRIVQTKRSELEHLPAAEDIPAAGLRRAGFADAIAQGRPAFIAEVKPRSPSAGRLLDAHRIPALVEAYDHAATAISVLCDHTYFGGGYDLLARVAAATAKPLLAKEFILDPRQIALAASHGASAVLLIAAILDEPKLAALLSESLRLGCDVLLEVHNAAEVDKAASVVASLGAVERRRVVLGINNRDLDSLEIDLHHTETLAPLVREKLGNECLLIAESGLDSPEACRRLLPCVDGFLIGTSILRSPDPAAFLSSLVTACNRE